MALTVEQLAEIKTKVETDKVRPIDAIRALHPQGNFMEIREQLFKAYNPQELLSHVAQPAPVVLTKEQKLERVNQQLQMMEQRKLKLQQEKTALEAE